MTVVGVENDRSRREDCKQRSIIANSHQRVDIDDRQAHSILSCTTIHDDGASAKIAERERHEAEESDGLAVWFSVGLSIVETSEGVCFCKRVSNRKSQRHER